MRKKGVIKYKWQIALMTLVFFCLSLVPFPNGFVDVLAETILKSPIINSDGTVTFNYQGNGTESAVKVKGEFSNWNTIDMEKGEGPELARKYGVAAFPTLLYVDKDGMLKHCVVGYLQTHELILNGEKALKGEQT